MLSTPDWMLRVGEREALYWAQRSEELNLTEVDEADEDTFNRILWHATRGEAPYPEAYIGRVAPGRQQARD